MPPRKPKAPSKDSIKRAADRAEGKAAPKDYSPLNPDEVADAIELEEMEEAIEIEGVKVPPRRKGRGGRPSKYKPEYARIAKALIKAGQTIPEIADVFGISVSTVWVWRSAHPEFLQAFLESNENFDRRVELALGQRAVGYDHDEVKVFNNNGVPLIVPIRRHIPPDVNAARFWLQARQNDKWRVKEEVEVTSDGEAFMKIWRGMGGKKDDAE